LAEELTIDGFSCAEGKPIEIFPGGRLKGCSLTHPRLLEGWSCQDGLTLHPGGRLRRCKVTSPRHVDPGVDVRPGDWVTLYEGGALKRLELATGPSTIQGYPCKGYLNFFHENGRLKKCELAADALVDGVKVSA